LRRFVKRETENGKREDWQIALVSRFPFHVSRLMRILIVRLSSMGDIVHALPLAANARAGGATVGWLTDRQYGGLLEGNPALARVFLADTRGWRRNPFSPAHWREIARLRRSLRDFAPDATVDVQGLWKSALLARLAGAPVVSFSAVARREPTSSVLVSTAVGLPRGALHVVAQNSSLLAPLGLPGAPTAPDARYLLAGESPAADAFLATLPAPFALYHPGASRAGKTWPVEKYAELASRLQLDPGLFPVVSWGPGDEDRAALLGARLTKAPKIPPLDFRGLARVIARASLFVAGDTGPVHLADALGIPALALFGPDARRRNTPERNGPYRGAAMGYDQTASVETVARKALDLVRSADKINDAR
jgi:lipopolysaccharide heptosyltransferase I